MTRNVLVAIQAIVAVATISVVSGTGCNNTGIGDPCIPEEEVSDTTFIGFQRGEVNVESKSFQCETRLCLVNHFQGRVSCPYGQAAGANEAAGATTPPANFKCGTSQATQSSPCCTPGVGQPVIAAADVGASTPTQSAVPANCTDRQAANAVYCSCRCANVNGQTNDGAVYCSCPNGYACTQLVSAINSFEDPGLTGAYCIKNNTAYDPSTSCSGALCNPTASPGQTTYCGPTNAVQ